MNSILIRSNNNTIKDNYKIVFIIIPFIIFKIIIFGIYPVFHGDGNLYKLFLPLIFYFIYFAIEFIMFRLFNKKEEIDNYILVLSSVAAFIVPLNTSIYVFLLGSFVGSFISHLSNNKISSIGTTYLIISMYLVSTGNSIYDLYDYPFNIVLLVMCLGCIIYLFINNLIKRKIIIPLLIVFMICIYASNNMDVHVLGTILFNILFVGCDNRFTPVTGHNMILFGVLFNVFILLFSYLNISYYIMLTIVLGNIITVILYYMDLLLLKKITK